MAGLKVIFAKGKIIRMAKSCHQPDNSVKQQIS